MASDPVCTPDSKASREESVPGAPKPSCFLPGALSLNKTWAGGDGALRSSCWREERQEGTSWWVLRQRLSHLYFLLEPLEPSTSPHTFFYLSFLFCYILPFLSCLHGPIHKNKHRSLREKLTLLSGESSKGISGWGMAR